MNRKKLLQLAIQKVYVIVFLLTFVDNYGGVATFNPKMDELLFSIDWADPVIDSLPKTDGFPAGNNNQQNGISSDKKNYLSGNLKEEPNENTVLITSKNNEQYYCTIPQSLTDAKKISSNEYAGPSEIEFLNILFKQTTCSYRIESFWTYELCHGRHLRQYHEQKEADKEIKLDEYYLGYYLPHKLKDSDQMEDLEKSAFKLSKTKYDVPVKQIDSLELRYFQVNFEMGTLCDLSGRPRRASLLYVCQSDGKGEIYSMKETSSCEYELVILSPQLCNHPFYESQKAPVSKISCQAVNGAPKKPKALKLLEVEAKKSQNPQLKDHLLSPRQTITSSRSRETSNRGVLTPDQQLLDDFLAGSHCLVGGSGWWHHEFCMGKYVQQFHDEKGKRTTIVLGVWNEKSHNDWIDQHPTKKPREDRMMISHYYGNGGRCDETGKLRWVEVKLKCKSESNRPNAISIYLVENKLCEYALVVESASLCEIVKNSDEYGLVQPLRPKP